MFVIMFTTKFKYKLLPSCFGGVLIVGWLVKFFVYKDISDLINIGVWSFITTMNYVNYLSFLKLEEIRARIRELEELLRNNLTQEENQ